MGDRYGDGWHQGLVQAEALARSALAVFDGDHAVDRASAGASSQRSADTAARGAP